MDSSNVIHFAEKVVSLVPDNDTAQNRADGTLARLERHLDSTMPKLTAAAEVLSHEVRTLSAETSRIRQRLDDTEKTTNDHGRRLDRVELKQEIHGKNVSEVESGLKTQHRRHDDLSKQVNRVFWMAAGISVFVGFCYTAFQFIRGI